MIENTILAKNRQGKKAVTFAMTFPSVELVEYAAIAGFDAVNLDGEHGAFNPVDVDRIVAAAHAHGMSVTARVPNIDSNQINRWLDRGVQGILGPHIETREQAQALADACLFPPDGWRSWGGGRGTEFNDEASIAAKYGDRVKFAQWANENMLVTGQIESVKGYENIDEILTVEGLAAVTWGAFDLSASLGHPGQPDHPEVLRIHAEVEEKARAAGVRLGSDYSVGMSLPGLLLSQGRAFVEAHADDAFE